MSDVGAAELYPSERERLMFASSPRHSHCVNVLHNGAIVHERQLPWSGVLRPRGSQWVAHALPYAMLGWWLSEHAANDWAGQSSASASWCPGAGLLSFHGVWQGLGFS